jgi:hypothetical protein
MIRYYPAVCGHCGGKGNIPDSDCTTGTKICPLCNGTGTIQITEFTPDHYPIWPNYYPAWPPCYPTWPLGTPVITCMGTISGTDLTNISKVHT